MAMTLLYAAERGLKRELLPRRDAETQRSAQRRPKEPDGFTHWRGRRAVGGESPEGKDSGSVFSALISASLRLCGEVTFRFSSDCLGKGMEISA
jgi:hypothetical protein